MLGSQYPHREIYRSGTTALPVSVSMYATKTAKRAYNIAVISGVLLILIAIFSFSVNYLPILASEAKYFVGNLSESDYALELSPEQLRAKQIAANQRKLADADAIALIQDEAKQYGVSPAFGLVIPKIDAKANVIANVDTSDQASYESALSRGIAHAAGTNFPGSGEGIFLFSHSTDFDFNVARYNAIFYLLRKLDKGDEIVVYFADDKYIYKVTDKHVVDADDVSWLTRDYDKETLVLQTCDPPGTTWKRLIVTAEPV